MVMTDYRGILKEIAHCSIANEIRSGASISNDCQRIVRLQAGASFQIPEPWSGQIDSAPILFISSNPSINELELYPDESWDLDRISDFFHNRFTSSAGWVDSHLRALRRDGTRTDWVRFWASARARAREILAEYKKEIVPGKDFALTEIVHCKSRDEEGVKEASDCCSNRYLERILSISAAKALIVYGVHARGAITNRFRSRMKSRGHNLCELSLEEKSRIVAFLPHPNERGTEKTLIANVGEIGLGVVRSFIYR